MSITSLQLIQISEYTLYKHSFSYSVHACYILYEIWMCFYHLELIVVNCLNECLREIEGAKSLYC